MGHWPHPIPVFPVDRVAPEVPQAPVFQARPAKRVWVKTCHSTVSHTSHVQTTSHYTAINSIKGGEQVLWYWREQGKLRNRASSYYAGEQWLFSINTQFLHAWPVTLSWQDMQAYGQYSHLAITQSHRFHFLDCCPQLPVWIKKTVNRKSAFLIQWCECPPCQWGQKTPSIQKLWKPITWLRLV